LLLHRHNWQALVANPALIGGAVDEILRFSPSIVAWRRRALGDTEIGGVAIPKGADILLLLGSANRDETAFSEPAKFDITRTDARGHLAFGYGIHFCVGQQLAKMELAIALEELARRMPDVRLKARQAFGFVPNSSFRTPTELHIEWGASRHD
jgi:cytochrome P450